MKKAVVSLLLLVTFCFGGIRNVSQSKGNPSANLKKNKITTSSSKIIKERKNYTVNQLYNAVLSNDQVLVKKILSSKEVNINQKNSDGYYPLEGVLPFENCEMAEILLSNGANPYVITSNKLTIYDTVMKDGSKKMKRIFLKYKK